MTSIPFVKKPRFHKSFIEHQKKNPRIKKAFQVFTQYKGERPPRKLPPGFRDHKLSGILGMMREVHLAQDSVLVYQDHGNQIDLVKVATHKELEGPRQKSLVEDDLDFLMNFHP